MSAPLTTRDALAEALRTAPDPGGWRAGMDGDDYAACLADALLASGALIDAGKLAEDEALVERMCGPDPSYYGTARGALIALAAALSAQSERAEVEL